MDSLEGINTSDLKWVVCFLLCILVITIQCELPLHSSNVIGLRKELPIWNYNMISSCLYFGMIPIPCRPRPSGSSVMTSGVLICRGSRAFYRGKCGYAFEKAVSQIFCRIRLNLSPARKIPKPELHSRLLVLTDLCSTFFLRSSFQVIS